MSTTSWPYRLGILALAALGGVMGGTLYYWSSRPPVPPYAYIIEGALFLALIAGIFTLRRLKTSCDEFAVAKKRLATQFGFQIGFALYAVVNLAPLLAPHLFRDFFSSLDGAREGFIMGQVAGMAPFVLGLLAGQFIAMWKYR
jgi:hypothetical protein